MASDRLSAADAGFLHIEDSSAHMHVAAVAMFDGPPPSQAELVKAIERRLHLVPRYRQKLAFVPGGVTPPRWVDDPHFNIQYHVRSTALPAPGSDAELAELAGRVFSQRLDRDKPLWELYIVEGLEGNRFALLNKTHHCLVDGVAGVDLATVLFDLSPEPHDADKPAQPWHPGDPPGGLRLTGEAATERVNEVLDIGKTALGLARDPRRVVRGARHYLGGLGAITRARVAAAPLSIYNQPIGPHRRFVWTSEELDTVKQIKNAVGGTVNDVVLATVAGALRRHLRSRGQNTQGLELKSMVPVSVRTDADRGSLGNRISMMYAPLPVGEDDPVVRLHAVTRVMEGIKESGQAVGAETLVNLAGFAPPTVLAQGARALASARMFNLTITNVPGPQFPLYFLGRELKGIFPMVPLAPDHAIGVAIMSYNGRLNFGFIGDYDVMFDLQDLVGHLHDSLAELADAATSASQVPSPKRKAPARKPAPRPVRSVD